MKPFRKLIIANIFFVLLNLIYSPLPALAVSCCDSGCNYLANECFCGGNVTKPPACSPSEICNTITGNCEASLFNPPAKSENRSKFCDNGAGINTALGCIPISSQGFINSVIKIIVNLSGGFSLVMMLYGVYTVTTSAGNPDKLKSGKDTITNAIIGLMFILLSVFLFQFIGINILNLPGVQ